MIEETELAMSTAPVLESTEYLGRLEREMDRRIDEAARTKNLSRKGAVQRLFGDAGESDINRRDRTLGDWLFEIRRGDEASIERKYGSVKASLTGSSGAQGGYLAGPERLINYLGHTTPAFVFSTACSPPNVAAALEGLKVIQREPYRVTRLRERSELFLKLAADCDLDTGSSADTPVIPVIVGNSFHAILLSDALFKRGINVQPILYPAVADNASRLRFFLSSLHSFDQLSWTATVVAEELAKIRAENG
jgi:hypothetical protein